MMAPARETDGRLLPLSAELRVHEKCKAFEVAWTAAAQAGSEPPEIPPFADGVSEDERRELLTELLLLDVEFRRQNRRVLSRPEYLAKLAGVEHGADIVNQAWDHFQPADSQSCPGNFLDHGRDQATSLSLLDRARNRQSEACTALVDLYGPLVYFWARRHNLSPEDAADVVQEVFRSVFEHLAGFRKEQPGDTFRGWLWTITRNKLRDHGRKLARRVERVGESESTPRWEEIPAEPLDDSAHQSGANVSDRLAQILGRVRPEFEERTWKAFSLAVFEDCSSAEIGARLGLTANAVRHAKARVLRRLREEYGTLIE